MKIYRNYEKLVQETIQNWYFIVYLLCVNVYITKNFLNMEGTIWRKD